MNSLLSDIERFLVRHSMRPGQFGTLAIGDKHLVKQLREGRDLRMSTVERLRKFMAEYVAEAA